MASFLSLLGMLGVPVALYGASLMVRGAQTIWAWAWFIAFVALDLAALWRPTHGRRSTWCLRIGVVALLAALGGRAVLSHPTASGQLVLLPSGHSGRWISRLFDDSDAAVLGFVLLTDVGAIPRPESRAARPLLAQAYRRLRADPDFAPVPGPFLPTMLGQQGASASDTLVFGPLRREGLNARRALVFLHGLGGGFRLPCWMLARRMPDALVVCPSLGVAANWNDDEGPAVLQNALTYASSHANTVYLVGLAGGAQGAQRVASRAAPAHVAGAVLLSGYDQVDIGALQRPTIPVLVLRGEQDTLVPEPDLQNGNGRTRVQNLTGGHYLLLDAEDAVLAAIDDFAVGR